MGSNWTIPRTVAAGARLFDRLNESRGRRGLAPIARGEGYQVDAGELWGLVAELLGELEEIRELVRLLELEVIRVERRNLGDLGTCRRSKCGRPAFAAPVRGMDPLCREHWREALREGREHGTPAPPHP